MYVINNNVITDKQQTTETSVNEIREESSELSYEVDVLSQFKANMAQLEDLQMRLKFVMNEVSVLMRKK
jgi:hypothetical protein